MNWYTGDIGAAIGESKSKKLLFLVYSRDSNLPNDNCWTNEQVVKVCNENCVNLKLESPSETFNQFKQIYPVTTLPTTYFIGTNGSPLEVVSGPVNDGDFLLKALKAIELHNSQQGVSASSSDKASTSSEVNVEQAAAHVQSTVSLEDKVAVAKEKIKMIQEKKLKEQEEKDKSSEIERRKLGQEVLKMKREKEELEIRKLAEEKRREKMEDEMAKKRVLEQIRLDREEKQKKYNKEKEEAEKAEAEKKAKLELEKQKEKQAQAAKNSNVARLQFRFVDGSSVVNQFTPDQTLDEVRQFVAQKLNEMNETAPFSMHSSFPKREYTQADMTCTLRDLQLAPSASLLIIPIHSSKSTKMFSSLLPTNGLSSSSNSSSSSSNQSAIVSVFSGISTFISFVWAMITGFFTSTAGNRPQNNENNNNNPPRQYPSISELRQRNIENRRSNIRNLNDRNDDDDNATWNGNSTQLN